MPFSAFEAPLEVLFFSHGGVKPTSLRISGERERRDSGNGTPNFRYAFARDLGPKWRVLKFSFGTWWILKVVPPGTETSESGPLTRRGATAAATAHDKSETASAAERRDFIMRYIYYGNDEETRQQAEEC
jgi:hypothetical protein